MGSSVVTKTSANSKSGSAFVQMAQRRPLCVFFCLAYLIFWMGMLPLVLSRTGLGLIPINVPMEVVFPLLFAPTVAAFLTQWIAEHDLKVFRLYGSWKRVLLGASVGSLLLILAIAVIPAVLLVKGSLRTLHWSEFISFGSISWFTFLGGPLGEETGWRGYALPRLQSMLGPMRASLVLGLLWTLWHLPLFFLPSGFRLASILVIATGLICGTLVMTFGENLSRFSIAAAVMMHFALNSAGGLYGGLTAGVEMRAGVPQEVVMPISIIATSAAIAALTRGRLAATRDPSPAHLF